MVSWGICYHSFLRTSQENQHSYEIWHRPWSQEWIIVRSPQDSNQRLTGHFTLEIKSEILVLSQDWVVLAVCAGAPSCWKRNDSFLNMICLRSFTTGYKINSLYVAALIFTPEVTKIRVVRPTADIPVHIITDEGFCARLSKKCCSGILEDVFANIRSFWEFVASSIVNNFSSEKTTRSRPWFASRLRRILFLHFLFSLIRFERKSTFFCLKEWSPKSFLIRLWSDPPETLSSTAIFLNDRLGLC